jgi:hypothetical protein
VAADNGVERGLHILKALVVLTLEFIDRRAKLTEQLLGIAPCFGPDEGRYAVQERAREVSMHYQSPL